jgi:hypothetical protein
MPEKYPESARGDEEYGPLPRPGLPVQVQCDGFKCMAFRTKEGKWIDFFTHESLPRVLGVVRA